MNKQVLLRPGAASLADWRSIYRGASVAMDPGTRSAVEASARTVDNIIAKGGAVYGINTGFGKLAHVRIGADDLMDLQRNIVLSHAAGVGERAAAAVKHAIGTTGDVHRAGTGRVMG